MAVRAAASKVTSSADVRASIQSQFGLGGEQYAVLFEVPQRHSMER